MEKYTYLLLMLSCIAFPIAFSFDKKVAFYKKWKALFWATVLPAIFFIIWDATFTSMGVWSFSEKYTLDLRLLGLPLEEWAFFVVIPYCSIFVYEVIKAYLPNLQFENLAFRTLTIALILFAFTAFGLKEKAYPFWNFTFNATILLFLLINKWFRKHQKYLILAFIVNLIPMFIVNGILTALPVVEYNPMDISGIRIYTIPYEDFFYFFLLLMMNVFIFERIQRKKNVDKDISPESN